jgi:putative membrane protein
MLVRPKRAFPGTLFLLRGSALADVWPMLLMLTVISIGATELLYLDDPNRFTLTTIPFSLIGLALSIFLGFRNNACYDRWWEARKLWGALINTTRSQARQIQDLVFTDDPAEAAEVAAFKDEMIRRTIGFAYGLKYHLRTEITLDAVDPWVPEAERAALTSSSNVPYALSSAMGRRLRFALERGWIDPFHLPILEASLTGLTDIQGGCERIKNTPVPLSYTMLTHRLVALYCLALPFGIASQVGHVTPLVVLFISYAFLGLDSMGSQLEDPFELDPNDLPLSNLARTIEINLLERLGVDPLPAPTQAERGVLV